MKTKIIKEKGMYIAQRKVLYFFWHRYFNLEGMIFKIQSPYKKVVERKLQRYLEGKI